MKRREFMKHTAVGAASIGAPLLWGNSAAWAGANDRVRIAVVGINGMGQNHIKAYAKLKNVEVAALCDVDENLFPGRIDALFTKAEEASPTIEGVTQDGTRHLLWRVSDPAVLAAVSEAMADKKLYIADGHHRYETMLALRDKLLAENPQTGEVSAIRFGMMFLANIDDPGLIVLPTHRLVHSVADFDAAKLRAELREHFSHRDVESGARDAELLRHELSAAAAEGTSFALVVPGESSATILTLRPDADLAAAGLHGSRETLSLDVTLLHDLVIEGILGIDRAAQAAQTSIHYIRDTQKALDRCAAGEGQVCFLMNATPVSKIVAVADADEVMPQKSTFFYPKIASGMVFNPIDIADELVGA